MRACGIQFLLEIMGLQEAISHDTARLCPMDTIQNYDVTYILCHFEKVNLKMKPVFNEKNQIAGLFIIPEN
jgi:hypothetical protein